MAHKHQVNQQATCQHQGDEENADRCVKIERRSDVVARFGVKQPPYVQTVKNRTGREYNYFRPPSSRPDLQPLKNKRLSNNLQSAGIEAAELVGTFVLSDEAIECIKAIRVSALSRSKQSNVPMTTSAEYLIRLYALQEGRCAVSGLVMDLRTWRKAARTARAMSLDRIDPKLGYVDGNLRWVCLAVNSGMNAWGYDEFLSICAAVVRKSKQRAFE